jgi:hypothetical protein
MEASTESYQQADLDSLSGIIPNFLRSVNSGTITIELDKQPLLRLKINQDDIDKINLDFGQKFIEILLEAFTEMISGKIKNVSL